jgi:hypothetical protein
VWRISDLNLKPQIYEKTSRFFELFLNINKISNISNIFKYSGKSAQWLRAQCPAPSFFAYNRLCPRSCTGAVLGAFEKSPRSLATLKVHGPRNWLGGKINL